ncbi:MAG: endonuclease [Bradyrhizobium sp.]|nr:endonuclease [Bradyrhizobium sp.]
MKTRPDLFYESRDWLELRYRVLKNTEAHCRCCGTRGCADNPVQVDHIKPRSKYPALALDISNLQLLCRDCNLGKGAWDETDWRSLYEREKAKAISQSPMERQRADSRAFKGIYY